MRELSITKAELLAEWNAAPDSAVAKYTDDWQRGERLPRYLQALGALGAFMAMGMFLSFLGAIGLIDIQEPLGMGIWGAIFTGAALYFSSRSEERMETLGDTFVTQTNLMLLALGKVMLICAVAGSDNWFSESSMWRILAAAALVTTVTYPFSRFYIDRYVSVLGTLSLLLFCILRERFMLGEAIDLSFNVYYLLMLAGTAWFFARPHYPIMLRPIRDVLVTMLLTLTLFVSFPAVYFYKPLAYSLHPISIGLTVALLATAVWMAGGIQKVKASQSLLLACTGIIALGVLTQPGILLAIGLMVLGYGRHERLLLVNGALSFAAFLALFYYNLEMTLLVKSTILAGSGAILLLARYYLHITRNKEA